jgi:hypothetical protein
MDARVRVAVQECKRLAMAFHALGRESLAEPSAGCYAELCAALDRLAALSLHVGDAADVRSDALGATLSGSGSALQPPAGASTAIPGAKPVPLEVQARAALALLKEIRYHAERHALPRDWLSKADHVLGTWGPVRVDGVLRSVDE